jgi:N-acetylmuramoyl-L-alanine amidase
MIECGFMSNEEENKKLQDNNYQQNLAFAIMLGYNNFLNGE